jgi:hypothetical protein
LGRQPQNQNFPIWIPMLPVWFPGILE